MRNRLQLESNAREKTLIHAIQVGGEERCFIAAGTRTDLDDRVTVVERVTWDDERLDLFLELCDALLEAALLRTSLFGELRVVNENELAYLRELVFVFAESASQLDDRSQASVLSAQLGQLVPVAQRGRVGQSSLDFSRASECVRDAISKRQGRASARLLAELLAEALDTTCRVHEPLLASEERVALRADVRVNLGLCRSSLERIAAGALHRRRMVFGMDVGFHCEPR